MSNKQQSSIDDKLRKIIEAAQLATVRDWNKFESKTMTTTEARKEAVAQIKQAFADEGYEYVKDIKESQAMHLQNDDFLDNLMTGKRWLSRFEKELTKAYESDHLEAQYEHEAIMAVAKRAAGIMRKED